MNHIQTAVYKYEDELFSSLLTYLENNERNNTYMDALRAIRAFRQQRTTDMKVAPVAVSDYVVPQRVGKKRGRKSKKELAAASSANSESSSSENTPKKKRVPSKYNLFLKDNLSQYRAEHPELSYSECFKAVAALWKTVN
jgi:hypothetical protein